MNFRRFLGLAILVFVLFQTACTNSNQEWQEAEKVHVVTDLSHEFTFYADHRFDKQYLPGQKGVTNWCNLYNVDLIKVSLKTTSSLSEFNVVTVAPEPIVSLP
mgnify:CR=1 FL=1